jgi:diguanylate cyclase (GGDEF)-like protein
MSSSEASKESSKEATILIVDDTPSNIQLLAIPLMATYHILVATNGEDALKLLQDEQKPDLILLDIMMPGMDGYEVCRRIKNDSGLSHIPVIFVTASTGLEEQKRGFDLGAVDYIAKPFMMPIIFARIKVHIRLKQKSDLLEKLAMLDGLTDIPNRRGLDQTLSKEWLRARRAHSYLSVCMIDIDYFKAFNDFYGHGVGDDCLRKVASAIKQSLKRPADFVGRYGGEEFMVILPDSNESSALQVAESIRANITSMNVEHEQSPIASNVTVSIGVASQCIDDKSEQENAIVMTADSALYAAKSQGRNKVVLAKDLASPENTAVDYEI